MFGMSKKIHCFFSTMYQIRKVGKWTWKNAWQEFAHATVTAECCCQLAPASLEHYLMLIRKLWVVNKCEQKRREYDPTHPTLDPTSSHDIRKLDTNNVCCFSEFEAGHREVLCQEKTKGLWKLEFVKLRNIDIIWTHECMRTSKMAICIYHLLARWISFINLEFLTATLCPDFIRGGWRTHHLGSAEGDPYPFMI